jgi:hypothetical protein
MTDKKNNTVNPLYNGFSIKRYSHHNEKCQ